MKITSKFLPLFFLMLNMVSNAKQNIFSFPDDIELSEIVNDAYKSSDIARDAINQEKEFREITTTQVRFLLNEVISKIKKLKNPLELREKIIKRIRHDMEFLEKFNKAIEPLVSKTDSFSKDSSLPLYVKTHKFKEILEGTIVFIEEHYENLIKGVLPEGYEISQKHPTILGDSNKVTIFGNSRGTFLKAALILILKELGELNIKFLHESVPALALVEPLPELSIDLSNFSFAVQDKNQYYLVLPHNGYSFGGHFNAKLSPPTGKLFAPEDCATWIGKMFIPKFYEKPLETLDLLCAYRKMLIKDYTIPQVLPKEDLNIIELLVSELKPVSIHDFKAGHIYCFRKFDKSKGPTITNLGKSGHVGLILGKRKNGQLVMLAYGRDMPQIEGFGIADFSLEPEPFVEKMAFSKK